MEGHAGSLTATIAIALGAAFVCGLIARRLGLPSIIGYLVAGIVIGPFTPGIAADPNVALELAEVGVALLMFGVGLHFSVRDLISVYRVAVPGAVGQIAAASLLGTIVGLVFGFDLAASLVVGLAVSVASTVVLLRTLTQRATLGSEPGRVAVGWLIVEDVFTVVALVLLPTLAVVAGVTSESEPSAAGQGLIDVGVALAKAGLLTGLMLVVGARVLPWLLTTVEGEGSRELFTLAVLAASLGVAFAATAIFDVSLALGGFLAGAVLSESRVSEKAAKDIVPLSDVFGVLFFVSVGMLLDPEILLDRPFEIVALLAVVVLGKSIAALAIVAALRRPLEIGLTVGAGLAQVGEFSFIVATEAHGLGILPDDGLQLVVAVSLLSITLNPAVFASVAPLRRGSEARPRLARALGAG